MSLPDFPERFSIAQYFLFDRLEQGRGDHVALRFGTRAWTYAEVAERSMAVARFLMDAGLRPEERGYVVLPDMPAFAWASFGLLAAGGVLTMGNPAAPSADVASALMYVRASALVTTPGVLEGLRPYLRQMPSLKMILLVPDSATGADPERAEKTPAFSECDAMLVVELRQAVEEGRHSEADLPVIYRDDPAVWLFTSGSTGRPKAAMHTQRDFAYNCEAYAKATIGYAASDVTVSVARLFFGYATGTNLWFPFAVGATVGLFSERPTPEALATAIEQYRPTIVTNVPTMMGKLLELDDERQAQGKPGLDLSCVRFHLSAGEALPAPLMTRFLERFGGQIFDGIGSAELFHIYCTNRPGDVKPGTLGRAVVGYDLKILPADATSAGAPELPRGDIGVLWVRGDSVALGYFQDRDKSWQTFHGHWCRTGDLFSMDADGYLTFAGRADDLFKVGGVFVSPIEVEDCLLSHHAVAAAAVIAASEDGLAKPKAIVVLRADARDDNSEALARELKTFVQTRLSKHKYPRWIAFANDLPKNDRGKIDRKRIMELDGEGHWGGV